MSDPISVGSVSVDVVPDARTFDEKLKAELRDLNVLVKATLDKAAFDASVSEATRERELPVRVNLDDKDAEARLDLLTRRREVDVHANASGTESLLAAEQASSGAAGGFSLLASAAVVLAPALIPLAASIGGVAAALSAPVLAAGGGGFLFALLAGKGVAETLKVNKKIGELRQQAASATSAKTRNAKNAQADALAASLSTPQKNFLAAEGPLAKAVNGLALGPAVLGPVVAGMRLLTEILPRLQPVIKAVGGAITDVLGSMTKAVKGGGFDAFVKGFARLAAPSIKAFAAILGNIAVGVGGLLKTFAPLGLSLLGVIDRATASFAKFGAGGGFKSFADYVKRVGPSVAKFFGSLGTLVGKLVTALAPFGLIVLNALTGIVDVLNRVPTPALLAIVGAIAGVVALAGGPLTAAVVAISAIVALFVDWYQSSATLRGVIGDIGKWIRTSLWPALHDLWSIIAKNLQPVFDQLVKTFKDDILPTLKKIWPDVQTLAKNFGKLAAAALIVWSAIYGKVYPVLIQIGGYLFKTLIPFWAWWARVLSTVVVGALKFVVAGIADVLDVLGHLLVGLSKIPGPFSSAFSHAGNAMENAASKARGLNSELDGLNGKKVAVTVNAKFTVSGTKGLLDIISGPSKLGVTVPAQGLTGLLTPTNPKPRRARALGGAVIPGVDYWVGEYGPERFRPSVTGTIDPAGRSTARQSMPAPHSGPQFLVEKVVAQDVNAFLQDMQRRAHHTALDGIAR